MSGHSPGGSSSRRASPKSTSPKSASERSASPRSVRGPKILVASGVNLDLLGTREPEYYGRQSLAEIAAFLVQESPLIAKLCGLPTPQLSFHQSNDEGSFLAAVTAPVDGLIINAGAWTHTSLALADRLRAVGTPYVEVHLSNLAARESFRQHSYLAAHAVGCVSGFGAGSYLAGLLGLLTYLAQHRV